MTNVKLENKIAKLELELNISEFIEILQFADQSGVSVNKLMLTAFREYKKSNEPADRPYRSSEPNIKDLRKIILDLSSHYGNVGVSHDEVMENALNIGMTKAKVEREIKKLKEIGEIFEPKVGYYSHS